MNLIFTLQNMMQHNGKGKTLQQNLFCLLGAVLLATFNASTHAEEPIKIRPQAGIGKLDGENSQHAGLRLLFKASEDKTYGLELTRMTTANVEYVVAGVILEKKVLGWFNMSIGSVGYFGQGSGTKNYPGFLTNLGWEPDTNKMIKPFVTLRQEVIFADKTLPGIAISAGLSVIY